VLALFGILRDEESGIREAVRRAGLEDRFSFLPFTSDTTDVYRSVDIVTFPNQGIGLGRPVLEAAVQGKPVVASGSRDGGGVLVPDVTGILLPDATPTAIAEALERLILDPALRRSMGEAAAAWALEQFDPGKNANAVEQLYDRLLDATRTTADSPTRELEAAER
jgi:glycosyltransferase involved in cell wall biosynthesis